MEFLLEVVAAFVGASVAALFTWCGSGFRRSYREEWIRHLERDWMPLFGLVFLVAGALAISAGIYYLAWP